MGSPLWLGCQVRGCHAADLRQSPAGLAASPSHPTPERPCPLPGLRLRDPPSWHLGLTALTPNLHLPAQTSPLAPAPVEGPSVPTALGEDSLPKTPHQLQPTAMDRCVHSLPQGPSRAQSRPAPLLACPLGPSYLLTCLDTPHPPSPLDPKAEIHPKPPHPPPAPLMSLSTPTPCSPEGLPRPSSLAAS